MPLKAEAIQIFRTLRSATRTMVKVRWRTDCHEGKEPIVASSELVGAI